MKKNKTDSEGRSLTDNDDASPKQQIEETVDRILGQNPIVGLQAEDMLGAGKALGEQIIKQPQLFLKYQLDYFNRLGGIVFGKSDMEPLRGDKRFTDEEWKSNPVLRVIMQNYLSVSDVLRQWVDEVDLKGQDKDRARFFLGQSLDALAPSNTFLNPAAVKAVLESKGKSLVSAVSNLVSDIVHEGGMPSQVDKSAFSVGENLATTEGKVVFRNEILELIQYVPTTEKVYSRPLLIMPPQINKYYVFDLSPEKSVVKYLLDQGQQVFIISWRNPKKEHSAWGMETYVEAAEDAIDVVCEISKSKSCNIQGSCSGGMTLVALAAYLVAKKSTKINSLTLFVCVFETSTESLLGMFANDQTIEAARENSRKKGVLDGKEMARVFAWLRPNDLVWNYWVNNYLLGKTPPAFDVLYWNADTTRLSAQYHSDLLDLFKDNVFAKPGKVKIKGAPIDVQKIDCDIFTMAGTTDHITPWEGCYRSAQLLKGQCDFVLSSSGHIQSILNPPGNPKAKYFLNSEFCKDPQEWLESAEEQNGSWWVHWDKWLAKRGGKKCNAPDSLGNSEYQPIMDAPGSYVFEE